MLHWGNQIIKAFKGSANGHYDISSQFIKLALHFVVNPLTPICNMQLTEGVFPDSLKGSVKTTCT